MYRLANLVFGLLVLAACRESVTEPSRPASPVAQRAPLSSYFAPAVDESSRWSNDVARQVDGIARDLAIRLSDKAARADLVAGMRAATGDNEHKLTLRGAMAAATDGPAAALRLGSAPAPLSGGKLTSAWDDLEAYFPVRSHRESYDGAAEVLVAYIVAEGEAPIAYDAAGTRRVLSPTKPPETPVLMITTRESVLRHAPLAPACENRTSAPGAIGTWTCTWERDGNSGQRDANAAGEVTPLMTFEELCAEQIILHPDCPPLTEPYRPVAGLYLTRVSLTDLHEPWPRGEPELVFHVSMDPIADREYNEPISVLNEHGWPNARHRYDQNHLHGSHSPWAMPGALLLSENQIDFIARNEAKQVEIEVWEDDYGTQETFDEREGIGQLISAATGARALFNSARGLGKCFNDLNALHAATGPVAVKKFAAVAKVCAVWKTFQVAEKFISVFGGDDDYIGVAAPVDNPDQHGGMTHAIVGNSQYQVGALQITGVNNTTPQ